MMLYPKQRDKNREVGGGGAAWRRCRDVLKGRFKQTYRTFSVCCFFPPALVLSDSRLILVSRSLFKTVGLGLGSLGGLGVFDQMVNGLHL